MMPPPALPSDGLEVTNQPLTDVLSARGGGERNEAMGGEETSESIHAELARTYLTPNEVAGHSSPHDDCWVSFLGRVYNMTPLIQDNRGELIQPIADAAGKDISHWFDAKIGDVKRYMNLETGLEEYYTPMGRFLHIPPSNPTDDFVTDFDLPWWMDHQSAEPQYWIGMLSQQTRKIRIVNMLTKDEHTLEVCSEDTVKQIQGKYQPYNQHAGSYAWKRLPNPGEGKDMIVLDMAKTLNGNKMRDEAEDFEDLGLDDDYYVPSIHLYFKDDLTEG